MRAVVTAVFGGYERIKAPPPGFDKSILITDGPADSRWSTCWCRGGAGLSAARAFFLYKLTPHIALDVGDDVLWIDGSFEPTGRDCGELFDMVPVGGVGMHRHPDRNCFYDEAAYSCCYASRAADD